MNALLHALVDADRLVSHAVQDVRLGPLTALFVVASAWWVKGLAFACVGGCADVWRRRLPASAISASIAGGLAALTAAGVKELVERARPPLADPTIQAAISLPHGYSFPSGHATTAFAAAAAVAVFHPRLRWPLFALATLVAASRVYLGVHFSTDVIAGAALGTAIGIAAAFVVRRASSVLRPAVTPVGQVRDRVFASSASTSRALP